MSEPATPRGASLDPAGMLQELESLTGAKIVYGRGCIFRLGALAQELGARRVLLVTDPGVAAAGHVERARGSLEASSIAVTIFDQVEENPTTRHVEAGLKEARQAGIDLLVGLGGGSAMDCAKGINFLLTQGGAMEDYWGAGRATRPMLPSIGVPTTAGTGSEAQSYALIEQEGTRRKMACGAEGARFRAVVLDPDLTATLPRRVAALSGLDAVSHAVESYVCTRAAQRSRRWAGVAWSLLSGAFEPALDRPHDESARSRMLLGAHLAGAAIEASMLGAAHACANPLTSRYEIPHGAAVLLMLPHVIRYNEPAAGTYYEELARAAGLAGGASLPLRIEAMRALGGLPGRMRDCGVPREVLPDLAKEALEQWTVAFNPRPAGLRELEDLYDSAW